MRGCRRWRDDVDDGVDRADLVEVDFSMGTLWILASEAPRSSKARMAVCLTASGGLRTE
jgi:hypothetical protein